MIPSWVVKVINHGKSGSQNTATIPCNSYDDAQDTANVLGGLQRKSAEVALAIPQLRGGTLYIPYSMLDMVRTAIDEAMEVVTNPATTQSPAMPRVAPFPKGAAEIDEFLNNNEPIIDKKFD
jgi:hypothetical protein